MKRSSSSLFQLLLVTALAISLGACSSTPPAKMALAHPADQYFSEILPPPPADDSDEHRAELKLVLAAQQNASPQVMERAKSEVRFTPAIFKEAIGLNFDEASYPKTFALLAKAIHEGDVWCSFQKKKFNRARPFAGDPRIKNWDSHNSDHLSYPSGHSFCGTLFGLILAKIFPDQATAIIQRSQEIGWDRIVAGMHHPSDINAGRFLANIVFLELLNNPVFQAELAQAKQEAAEK